MRKPTLYIALFSAFIDHMGIGLVYPMFSSMLFDPNHPLLSLETSTEVRGMWLGVLIALMPLAEFFSAPIWGALSDSRGRKKTLQMSLVVGIIGYLTALSGVFFSSIALLLLSRLIVGCAAGNVSIVQAVVADLSTPEEKAKNFGLYCAVLGFGFTIGPFLGGYLSQWGYSTPFVFATLAIGCNLAFVMTFFKETHHHFFKQPLSWSMGLTHLKKAFRLQGLKMILLCSFLHNFGWSFFFEFIPVYLIDRFQFTSTELGFFYGAAGGFYALSTGLLIRPFVSRFKSETLFFGGNFSAGLAILLILALPTSYWLWPLLFLICYCVAFVTPSSTTIISNGASSQVQGEALGTLTSVNAAALVLSPLFSGALVGAHPTLSIWIGSAIITLAALIVGGTFRGKLIN